MHAKNKKSITEAAMDTKLIFLQKLFDGRFLSHEFSSIVQFAFAGIRTVAHMDFACSAVGG
jgi:hypothetical protein